ncbi:MAG: hypothetical protein JW891_14945 [Candidatus Lokiarchaeota archaeon]|nr:hypothetical protein [Candidatus Lokiarchaeota archaeon]
MRVVNGYKGLFKKPLLVIIFVAFLVSWVLYFITYSNPQLNIGNYIALFTGFLAAFTLIILIFSIFAPIEKIGIVAIIIAIILVFPLTYFLGMYVDYLYLFCFFANQVITAFFAFKFCMDTSTKVDRAFYKSKNPKVLRTIEFFAFLILTIVLIYISIRLLLRISPPAHPGFIVMIQWIFEIVVWVLLILLIIVLVTLIILQKLAAYIPLFYIFVVLYVSYIILNIWAEFKYINNPVYDIFAFVIDLLLFIYIIGSIFDRVEYFHDHIKIIRADTIAVFFILMKMLVQIINIRLVNLVVSDPDAYFNQVLAQAIGLFIYFMIMTLIIGIFQIFIFKQKKK